MSQHTIKRKRGGHLVLGYDRPLKDFFCQVWSRGKNIQRIDTFWEIEVLFIMAGYYGGVVPEGLYDQILDESEGRAETNTCKDWR